MRLKVSSLVLCFFALSAFYDHDEEAEYLEELADDERDDDYLEEVAVDDQNDYDDEFYEEPIAYSQQDDEDFLDSSSEDCVSPFHRMSAGVRHTEGRGMGYESGYTTLDLFGIYDGNNSFMPFFDLRGHVFNNGKLAGNVGIGERTALFSISHLLGVYCYYDVRQNRHGLTVNQVSPGIELLGSRMEYRLNGYFPMGRTKSHRYQAAFDKFDGNNIILKTKRRKALRGGEGEVGVHITQSTKYDLYTGVGPYYFNSSNTTAWGGKVRLLGRYKEYVSLEATYSYDRLFKNVIQGTVAFNMPFGGRLKQRNRDCSESGNLWFSRAAFAPQRIEIPVIKKVKQKVKAINPATGRPWQVWFVDNTSSSAGTFQSPFPTLAQAQNVSMSNDMIYVCPGNGTSSGMDTGITLKDGQKLFGSAIAHSIHTTDGKITLPKFSSSSPLITTASGNVVNLSNGNEVSGMHILMSSPGVNTAAGIGSSLASIQGATLNNNTIIVTTAQSGINFNASGEVNITSNQVASTLITAPFGIVVFKTGSVQEEIAYNNVSGFEFCIGADGNFNGASSDIMIRNNTLSNYLGFGIAVSQDEADARISIVENTIVNARTDFPSSGIVCQNVDQCLIQGNQISYLNNPLPVLGIVCDSATQSIIDSNQVTFAPGLPNCIGITYGTSTSTGIHYVTSISKNTVVLGGGAINVGFGITTDAGDSACASVTNNRVISPAPGTSAFDLATTGSGNLNIQIFEGNIGSGLNTSNTSTGVVNFGSQTECLGIHF